MTRRNFLGALIALPITSLSLAALFKKNDEVFIDVSGKTKTITLPSHTVSKTLVFRNVNDGTVTIIPSGSQIVGRNFYE